jgi:hypothetical protein
VRPALLTGDAPLALTVVGDALHAVVGEVVRQAVALLTGAVARHGEHSKS